MLKQGLIVLVLACFFMNACSGIKSNNGYMPVQDSVNKLRVNVTSTASVKSKLGEPALILGTKEPVFVYASQITNRVLFFKPKVISRDVLVLYFNKKRKLKKITKYNLKDGKSFDINTDTTNLNAEQKSLIATFFSNIGVGGLRVSN